MTSQDVIDKKLNHWENMKNFLDSHTDENGSLSAEDAATYEKMEKDFADFDVSIQRLERQEKIAAQMSTPTTKPILLQPDNHTFSLTGSKSITASAEYKQAVLTALRTNFRQVSNYLQESIASDGGYLVPDEWDSRIIDVVNEENVMRQLGTTIQTSGSHKINVAATKPSAGWVQEGGAYAFTDTTFSQVTLDSYKLQVGVKVTNELLYDEKYNLENYLIEQFGRAIGNEEEDAFLNGAATDTRPTGLFVTAAANSENVITTATTDTKIAADDVIDLIYKLKRPYRKNAVFIMNDATIAQIRKLTDGNKAYIWQPSYTAGEPDTLLGYKVYTSSYAPMPARGATVIAFGDMSYYNIADRETRTFSELRELFAVNGMTGFLMTERVDGALILPEAVKVLKLK